MAHSKKKRNYTFGASLFERSGHVPSHRFYGNNNQDIDLSAQMMDATVHQE